MKKIILCLFLSTCLVGCTNNEKTIEVNNGTPEDKEVVTSAIENRDDIYSGRAIFVEDQLLVAIQAKPWLDYKKTKIEKSLEEELKERLPNYDITVSSDFKLYWEAQKLLTEEDLAKMKDQVEKLKKLSKEET